MSRLLLPLVLLCALSPGQTRSSLNGAWRMDPARSDFGSGPVPVLRLDRIHIDGAHMKDTITQKLRSGREATYDMNYVIGGPESTNRPGGNRVKSTARWDGRDLVVDSTVYAFRVERIEDRWSVSADGKTLTLLRHMTGPLTTDQKIVSDRQ